MSTKYFALLTQLGADKLANAAALGTKIEITHMAVGDGGGSLPVPDTKQTKLINEKRRAAINTLSIDPKNTNQIIAEQVIPEAEGGWWIREIGLYDKDGVLVAVGNCAETYKPQLQEGSGRTQTIRMILIVSSANAVTLKVDPSIVLATREYVDNSITKHANSRNHPDATLKEKGFVILSSAVDSNSETHAATPKAVKAAYDLANAANNNANTRLEKSKNGADVTDKDAFNRNIGSARAFTGAINIGGGGVWTTAEFIEWLKSQGAFNHPYWVCKGSWSYASNRRITETGCGSIHLAGAVVEVMGTESVMTIRVTTAPTSVDGCIPNAQFTYGNHGKDYQPSWRRDYNTTNKPTSDEVGAYSKEETDARVNAANENANSRLEKNKNGADIPNKDEFVKNLGLTETKELAAGALSKSIVTELGNSGTFESCNTAGIYNIAIPNPATVLDFPKVNGNSIYGYGMMIVTKSPSCTSQFYMSHRGHIAVRQLWHPGKEYSEWNVQYSSVNKPSATDIGAFPITGGKVDGEVQADNFWAKTNLNLGEGTWGERHGINIGPVDNASFEGNNVEIRSWYGIGLKSTLDNKTRIFFNPRNGDIGTKGTLLVGAEEHSSLKISSNNTAKSPMNLYTFGDLHVGGSRHVVLEAADDKGWLWYSTRLTSNQIEFAVNGKVIPNDYSNFDARYVQDIRLGTVEHSAIWRGYGFSDTPPYVITAVVNDGNNEPDLTSRRPLQKLINGTWHNIGAL